MGNQLIWEDRFNIGVDSIDREHKKLFSVLNRMLLYKDHGEKNQWVCMEGIKYFKDHAMKHFTEEEAYMASIGYVGFETHRRVHDNFRKKTLPALEKELKQTNYSEDAINHFLGVCAGWLFGHTLTEDRAITGKAVNRWINLLPDEEQAVMKQTIMELLYDLFRLQPKVVSECYGGEKFGKGIYYRLVYGNDKKERWEIILVFEEKLIINTMGSVMGTKSEKVNVMLMNASRYTAQQFVNRVRENFPSVDEYELKEENLLSYEQFRNIFKEQLPQLSFLFDTGEGYFAYCVIAPHLLQNKGEIAIKTENAMTEVKAYLEKENDIEKNSVQKKKILVVDDSDFMLQAIEKLLMEDYEVVLANSGLSAIRCITLNRPDLVLLDYDMSVCNGSQILEMIRSERDFANISVIFLTGKMDKESVEKVIALKPEGYLLKTLRPTEIKKKIDDFFKRQEMG